MPDANKLRQQRHTSCLSSTRCPKCGAWPGRECHELRMPWSSRVYPRRLFKAALKPRPEPPRPTGPVKGKIGRAIWGRELGGLHKERWAEWEKRSVIEQLAELVERPS